MFSRSPRVRSSREEYRASRPARRSEPDLVALSPAAASVGLAPRATSPDVLELLLLHGDCAFLLDLREL